jgi:hypothetical protein
MKSILTLIVFLLFVSSALAQDRDRPRSPADPFDNPPPLNVPGARGGGGGGNPMMMQVELMRNWLELIERYARLSRDPIAAGVAAVVSADDLFKGKPPEQAIEYFTKLLSEVKNESVQRAIRFQLVELYGKNNQQKEALEQLRTLMIDAPAGGAGGPPGPGGDRPGTRP